MLESKDYSFFIKLKRNKTYLPTVIIKESKNPAYIKIVHQGYGN